MEREAAVREAEQRAEGGSHMKGLPDPEDHATAATLQNQAKQHAANQADQRRKRGYLEHVQELRDHADDAEAAASKKATHRRDQEHETWIESLREHTQLRKQMEEKGVDEAVSGLRK